MRTDRGGESMSNYIALYNPYANIGNGEKTARQLEVLSLDGELRFQDLTKLGDCRAFFGSLSEKDKVILCGGDGTLNRFVNAAYPVPCSNEILYYACGTGNDFLRDIGQKQGLSPVAINDYLRDLPLVRVNGRESRFLNNVGFGIDGYCTQVGDEMRAAHKENINYTAIAIKGLLGGFHPVGASVTVDGVTKEYRHVWLAPTMKGRYYGGGMMPTPAQDRNAADRRVSVMVFRVADKLRALMVFPSIFQGEHVKHTRIVEVRSGHEIRVRFDRPCPLQIDGETIRDVTEYEVSAQ